MWLYVQISWHTVGPPAALTIFVVVQITNHIHLTL